jgi:short-subunit dehydrogenase
MEMTHKLSGRVAVITGASSGIARATARRFAREGMLLVLVARREQALEDVADECRARGGVALVVPTDMSEPLAVAELAQRAVAEFGRIDIWVNCAAVLQFGRIEDTPPEILHRVFDTNLFGYALGAQAAIRQFRRQKRGTLINVSSALAATAQPYAAAYVATKFAIRGLSDSIRQEIRDEPAINVCTVLPFAIDTPIYQRAANYLGRAVKPLPVRYAADSVAETILGLARRPRREVFAGRLGGLAALAKSMAPSVTEHLIGTAVETTEIDAKPQAPHDGNLFYPRDDAYTVSGKWGHLPRIPRTVLWGGLAAMVAGVWIWRRHR